MATPSSYPLTNIHIETEFGSDVDTSGECLGKGGAPSSYPLTSADMLGLLSQNLIDFSYVAITKFSLSSSAQYVYIQVNSDGTMFASNDSSNKHTWLGGGSSSDYEVRFSYVSGTSLNYGPIGVWTSLSSSFQNGGLTYGTGGFGSRESYMKVEIRNISNTSEIISDDSIRLFIDIEK